MSRKMPFLVLLIAAMSPAVHAQECYDWLSKDAILAADPAQYTPVSLAFDENVNKMALLTSGYWNGSNIIGLWYFDGNNWHEAWEGIPQSTWPVVPPMMLLIAPL